jgi:hypothetical protein
MPLILLGQFWEGPEGAAVGALDFTAVLEASASAYIEKRQRLHKNPYYLLWESVHRD